MTTMTFRASGPLDVADEWLNAAVTLSTADALVLFEFLGLGGDDFGVCEARDLAARVRRGLWPSRNAPSEMRTRLLALLDLAERARDGLVVFDEDHDVAAK